MPSRSISARYRFGRGSKARTRRRSRLPSMRSHSCMRPSISTKIAIRTRNRALAIWEKLLAYPTVAMELQSLARDDFARKNYASTSAFNQRAISFQEVFAGRYPGLLMSSLRYQARVLRELHLDPEALAMDDRANK